MVFLSEGKEKTEGEDGVGGGGEPAEPGFEGFRRGRAADFAEDVAGEKRRNGGATGSRKKGPEGVVFRQVVFHEK